MALFLEAVNVSGVVQRTPVNSARVRITAQQGFTYKLVDDQGAKFDENVSVRRDRNSLIVDGLPAEQVVELDGFFFNCVPSSPCTFVTENLGGTANITPASEPVGALQDGSFMMFTKGQLAAAVPVAPEAEFIPKNVLVGLGAVALLGVAAGGGGGSKSSSSGGGANDTTPPDAPLLTSARSSKDAKPVLTGTAEAGSIVVVSLDIDGNGVSDVSYESQTDSSGNWSIDLATATPSALALPAAGIPDGANVRIILRARDQANNTSTQATTEFLVIDRTPPVQTATITNVVDDEPGQTGSIASGGSSNDRSPTLSGSISAPLAAGDRIQVLRDAAIVGEATINGTLWTFTDTVAPGTTVAANYTVRAADALGNGGTPSTPYLINLDTRAPATPTVSAVSTDDIINFTEAGVPVVVAGTAEAGATLNLTWGLRSFSAVADGAGQWQVAVPANQLPGSGSQTISAIAIDAAGNSSPAGTRTVSVVTGLPSSPITNPVTGDNRINAAEAAADITVSGLADPGNTVSLVWAGIPGTRTVTASSTGVWSVNYTLAEIAALPQGAGNLVATATDIAGNIRIAPAVSIDKDSIVPGQTLTIDSVTDNQAPVTGAIGSGGVTNDQTPTLNGSLGSGLASGDTIHVFRNGVDVGNATASGLSWSFTDTLASNGSFSYTARIIDAAGNLGTNISAAFGIVLDTVAPTQTASITSLADDVAPVVGNIASGGTGNDSTPTLTGALTGALASGDTVQILRNGADTGAAVVSGLTWTFTDSGLVSGNSYTYTARVQDAAGNQTASSAAQVYVFDNTVPAPTINAVATDNLVNLAEATAGVSITGNVESGATVAVTWGTTTLTTTASGGTYSVNFSSAQVPANGASTVSVVATDAAGNANAAVTRAVTIDRTAPALPTIGLVAGDDIVSAGEAAAGVSVSGTAEAGSTVSVVWGSTTLTQVASGGTYNLSFTPGQVPPAGVTTVTVTAQDPAGNNSVAATRSVTVSAASKTAAVTGITDDVAPIVGPVTNGATSNDGAPALAGTLSAALGVGETLHVYRNGVDVSGAGITPGGTTWSFTDSSGGMVSGTTYTYTARVVDSVSVAGPIGTSFAMIFDNVSPVPVISVVAGNDIVDFAERTAGVAVSGTAEAGSSVAVTWGSTTLTGTATGGSYSINFSSAQIPADGPSSITAVATDLAGNVSTTASHALTIATTSSFTGTAGADSFSLTAAVVTNLANPASVLNGAGGIDTLTFTGTTPLNLNLTSIGNSQLTSFERVDMTGGSSTNNTLTLNASDVLAMGGVNTFTGAAWGGLVANGQTQLVIDGDTGDALTASGGWASAGPVTNSGVTYLVFNATSGASAVQLLVDAAITRTIT